MMRTELKLDRPTSPERLVSEYLSACRETIDAEFGEGYAIRNPQLVGVLVTACAGMAR